MDWKAMLHRALELLLGDSTSVSVVTTVGVLLVLLAPVALVSYVAYRNAGASWASLTGLVLGAVALPLSLWLYLQFHLDSVRKFVLGLPGKGLVTLHFSVAGGGAEVERAIYADPMTGLSEALVRSWPVAFTVWVAVYTALGIAIDLVRQQREKRRLMAASRRRSRPRRRAGAGPGPGPGRAARAHDSSSMVAMALGRTPKRLCSRSRRRRNRVSPS